MAALSLHCTTLRVAATSGVDCRRFQANRASAAASASCSSFFTSSSSSSSSSCSVSSLGSRFSTVRYGWGNNGRRPVRAVIEEAVASEQVDVQAPTDNLSMYFKVRPLFLVFIVFFFLLLNLAVLGLNPHTLYALPASSLYGKSVSHCF